MKYLNILEKTINLFTIAKNSWINLVFLGISLLLLILLFMKKITKKTSFLVALLSYITLITYTIVTNFNILSKTGNNLLDQLFVDIYFPSTYVYLFVFLFINIVTIGSLINIKKKSTYKTVNGIVFLITNFIFVLILEIISNQKIDIFKKSSIFSNKDLIILLELSVSIFIIWLLGLALIYLSNIITEHILLVKKVQEVSPRKKKEIQPVASEVSFEENTSHEPNSSTGILSNNGYATATLKEEPTYHFIPTLNTNPSPTNKQLMIENLLHQNTLEGKDSIPSIIPTIPVSENLSTVSYTQESIMSINKGVEDTFDLSSFIPKQPEKQIIHPNPNTPILEQILNNDFSLIQEQPAPSKIDELEIEKNTYTLNDYRIFNKMLKDIREHNQNNSMTIDKNLEYRLITKYSSETYNLFKRMLKNYSN